MYHQDILSVFDNALDNGCSVIDLNERVYELVGKTIKVFGDIFKMLEVMVIVVLVALSNGYKTDIIFFPYRTDKCIL